MPNLTEAFQTAKDHLDIREVAELYGVHLDRSGKACCPFHNEKTPSFAINEKGQYFKCFGCGEGGDAITLAGKLLGIDKPLDALKRLNDDFTLGLSLEPHRLTRSEKARAAKRKHQRKVQADFEAWINAAFTTCSEYLRLLRRWEIECAPKAPGEEYAPHFVEAMQNLSRMEYLCDCLVTRDKAELQKFYLMCRQEVKAIERRLRAIGA